MRAVEEDYKCRLNKLTLADKQSPGKRNNVVGPPLHKMISGKNSAYNPKFKKVLKIFKIPPFLHTGCPKKTAS